MKQADCGYLGDKLELASIRLWQEAKLFYKKKKSKSQKFIEQQ